MTTGITWLGRRAILPLAVFALGAAGCAASPPIQVPGKLPNTTNENLITLQWALVREATTARAVGTASSNDGAAFQARVFLYGVNGQGRVVSQAATDVESGFGPFPPPDALRGECRDRGWGGAV